MSTKEQPSRRSSSRIANRGTNSSTTTSAAKEVSSKTKKNVAKPISKVDDEPVAKKSKTSNDDTKTTSEKSGSTTLKVGDKLPSIQLQDESGKEVDIASLKNTVIFTYPKANTGGCTAQACLFRDEYDQWKKLGFTIFGLSNDGLTSLKNWKEKKSFQYDLLSDPKRILIGKLTGSTTQTRRSHFVIDGQGKLALSSISIKPAESSPAALKFAKTL